MDLTRRASLSLCGLVLSSGLTGCVWTDSAAMDTERVSPTSSPTDASPPKPNLSFSAETIQQASADAPARVAATLSNDGQEDVKVSFGPTLLFTDNVASDDLEWADELVLDPESYIGPWSEPEQTGDGCWRFPKDGKQLVQSSDVRRESPPDEPLHETYDVYTHGKELSCLPEGTYRFQDKGSALGGSWSMVLTLILTVTADKQLSATTAEPTFISAESE